MSVFTTNNAKNGTLKLRRWAKISLCVIFIEGKFKKKKVGI